MHPANRVRETCGLEQQCQRMGLRTELSLPLAVEGQTSEAVTLQPPNRRKQELQTPTPSFVWASTRKHPCFGQMDWNVLLKITLQHKHTYGFCYLLGNKVRGLKPHPQALGK